jgi:hypothetical protein
MELSEVWYVEVDPGDRQHSLDIAISAEGGNTAGWICPFESPDGDMRQACSSCEMLRQSPGSKFEIRDFKPGERTKMGLFIHLPKIS